MRWKSLREFCAAETRSVSCTRDYQFSLSLRKISLSSCLVLIHNADNIVLLSENRGRLEAFLNRLNQCSYPGIVASTTCGIFLGYRICPEAELCSRRESAGWSGQVLLFDRLHLTRYSYFGLIIVTSTGLIDFCYYQVFIAKSLSITSRVYTLSVESVMLWMRNTAVAGRCSDVRWLPVLLR